MGLGRVISGGRGIYGHHSSTTGEEGPGTARKPSQQVRDGQGLPELSRSSQATEGEEVSKSLHSSLLFLSGKTQCFTSSFIQGCTMAEMTLNTGISTLVAEGDNIRDIDFESARP